MNNSRYTPGNAYPTCPAASGECSTTRACPSYPDGAHHCRHDRRPTHHRHLCLCQYQWITLTADALNDDEIQRILAEAKHAA